MKQIEEYKPMETGGILLNANESYKNIEAFMIEEIQQKIANVLFHRYPEDRSEQLIEAYSIYIGVEKEQIVAGNGSDEMLGLIIGLTIKEGKKLYTYELDFSMYDYYTSMHNGEVIKYPWKLDEPFDVDKFIEIGKKNNVDIIIISNPNNPTGRVVSQKDLCKIVEAFSQILVVIDEAYAEFDDTTMIKYIDKYKNLLVTRTLSKAFALASIRCGFLMGNKETIEKIRPYKVPYNVNRLTQESAIVVLNYWKEIMKNVEEIKKERQYMYEQYEKMKKTNITLYPSKANYFYGVSKEKNKLLEMLGEKNIVIRTYDDDSFRITIGSRGQNEMVLEVIKKL